MTVAEFAAFWRRQGCRTAKGAGTYWQAVRPLVFLSLPYERPIQPTRLELLRMLTFTPALVLRYPAPASEAKVRGGAFICRLKGYDFETLQPKARNHTRKGLRECTVQQMGFGDLSELGYSLNEATWRRQGRTETVLTPERWKRYCEAARVTPDMEAWGAFVGGQLAAFAVCAAVENCYNILFQSSSSDLLRHSPNNALAFVVTKRALELPGVDRVCYGLRSVEDTEGLDHFKFGMGFSLLPLDERFALHPVLKVFLRLGGRKAVQLGATRRPRSDFWRKALAMARMPEPMT